MKARYSFIDPSAIMGVVVALVILCVGIYAFFVTLTQIIDVTPVGTAADPGNGHLLNSTRLAVWNVSDTGDSVFNIIGIVLIIGAIMSIVGLVYNYVR